MIAPDAIHPSTPLGKWLLNRRFAESESMAQATALHSRRGRRLPFGATGGPATRRRTRILVVAGAGGHGKECLRLVDLLGRRGLPL